MSISLTKTPSHLTRRLMNNCRSNIHSTTSRGTKRDKPHITVKFRSSRYLPETEQITHINVRVWSQRYQNWVSYPSTRQANFPYEDVHQDGNVRFYRPKPIDLARRELGLDRDEQKDGHRKEKDSSPGRGREREEPSSSRSGQDQHYSQARPAENHPYRQAVQPSQRASQSRLATSDSGISRQELEPRRQYAPPDTYSNDQYSAMRQHPTAQQYHVPRQDHHGTQQPPDRYYQNDNRYHPDRGHSRRPEQGYYSTGSSGSSSQTYHLHSASAPDYSTDRYNRR